MINMTLLFITVMSICAYLWERGEHKGSAREIMSLQETVKVKQDVARRLQDELRRLQQETAQHDGYHRGKLALLRRDR